MKKLRRVAIIGGKAEHRYLDIGRRQEIWGLNGIRFEWIPRWTRMFNLHVYDRLVEYGYDVRVDAAWAYLHKSVPFYVLDQWPEATSNHKILPREKIAAALAGARNDYHCGSFDWMVAFALYLGFAEIALHGVCLSLAGEPISARACLEYWCGFAEAKGVKIITAPDCDLFHFFHQVKSDLVYGYDDTPIFEDRTRRARKGAPYRL